MNKGIRFGYARVSTSSQKLDLQRERLADCDRTFHEKVSGKSAKNRPGLQNALNFVREGNVFVVTKLDYRILQTQQNKNGQPHFDVVVSVSDYTEDRINPSFLSQSVPSLIGSRHAERSHNLRISPLAGIHNKQGVTT